ncbi:MAG: nucleotidyltransferase domain-containing protein [Leptolyngbya sp.]|nr:nucleotidyltransferase domain-containing protein [Leptolyngbya sp.]
MVDKTARLRWRAQRIQTYLSRLPLQHYRAIVFGSVARGDFILESDTDLLIISDELPPSPKARLDILFDPRLETPEIEPIGWREEDYQRRKAAGDPFLRVLEQEGIPWETFAHDHVITPRD